MICIISGLYAYGYKKENIMNLTRLEWTQYLTILGLSTITIYSSLAILELEEVSVLKTAFILKAFSMIILVIIGIFFLEEKVTSKDISGILLIILGCFLIKYKY